MKKKEVKRKKRAIKKMCGICLMIDRDPGDYTGLYLLQAAHTGEGIPPFLHPPPASSLHLSISPAPLSPRCYTNRCSPPDLLPPAPQISPSSISFNNLPMKNIIPPFPLSLLLCVSLSVWLLIFLHCSACLSPRACHLYSNRCAVYVTDVFFTCSAARSHSLHGE